MKYRIPLFLILNFGILAISTMWVGEGITGEWYKSLNHAPWSPPSWVFGFSWMTLMICFSVFMAYAWGKVQSKKKLMSLYGLQAILNISWSPIYFGAHMTGLGLIVLSSLAVLMIYFLISYRKELGKFSFLVLPYILWLITAISLNAYIVFYN